MLTEIITFLTRFVSNLSSFFRGEQENIGKEGYGFTLNSRDGQKGFNMRLKISQKNIDRNLLAIHTYES